MIFKVIPEEGVVDIEFGGYWQVGAIRRAKGVVEMVPIRNYAVVKPSLWAKWFKGAKNRHAIFVDL